MAGFTADWLALREPADHRARSGELAGRVAASLRGRDPVRILDLGCGTGSNLRAFAPLLGPRQHWTLIDHDASLIAAAMAALDAWTARHKALDITIAFQEADLAAGLDQAMAQPADLVTAAALFDLVSAAWIADFATRLAARRLPLYTTLIYDGTEHWEPAHPLDPAIHAAFLRDQRRDKGFGPAAGPRAAPVMAQAFEDEGYAVTMAASPWRLGPSEQALMGVLAQGMAGVAATSGAVTPHQAWSWAQARAQASACIIGHLDLWARPK